MFFELLREIFGRRCLGEELICDDSSGRIWITVDGLLEIERFQGVVGRCCSGCWI